MSNLAVLGLQWGDEGKGKLIDLAAENYDVVVRCQGGNNAGHTVQVGEQVYKLSLIPSGVLRPGKIGVVGNGVVINPEALLSEIDALRSLGVDVESNLLVSNRAHVCIPVPPGAGAFVRGLARKAAHRHHLARYRPLLRRQGSASGDPRGRTPVAYSLCGSFSRHGRREVRSSDRTGR